MRGKITIAAVVAFLGWRPALYLPLQRFSELSIIVATALAAIERIFQFFDETPEVHDAPGAMALHVSAGRVEIEHLGFGYKPLDGGPARTILHDVNLHLPARPPLP